MQTSERDVGGGNQHKIKKGIVTLVIASFNTTEFLEAIEKPLYHIPVFIDFLIKRPRVFDAHFRRYRIPAHADSLGFLLCHTFSSREAFSTAEPLLHNPRRYQQTAKMSRLSDLFQRWHESLYSTRRASCRCCTMSGSGSFSYTTAYLYRCFDCR